MLRAGARKQRRPWLKGAARIVTCWSSFPNFERTDLLCKSGVKAGKVSSSYFCFFACSLPARSGRRTGPRTAHTGLHKSHVSRFSTSVRPSACDVLSRICVNTYYLVSTLHYIYCVIKHACMYNVHHLYSESSEKTKLSQN